MTEVYFFDTYAFFEMLRGNVDYVKYQGSSVVTTKLNLFELFYAFLREEDEHLAQLCLQNYNQFTVDLDINTIEYAARFKYLHKKKKLSMTDCIGYILAQKMGIKFLTGDQQFANMINVEFVK